MSEHEVVIIGRDNEFAMFLLSAGAPETDLSPITRVVLFVHDQAYDTDDVGVTSDHIWWTDSETWRPGVTRPVIKFKIGGLGLLPEGEYRKCRLVTYDAGHPNGLEWSRDLTLTFVD